MVFCEKKTTAVFCSINLKFPSSVDTDAIAWMYTFYFSIYGQNIYMFQVYSPNLLVFAPTQKAKYSQNIHIKYLIKILMPTYRTYFVSELKS